MSRLGAGARIALTSLLLAFSVVIRNAMAAANDQICDVVADFALGQEDYPKAIVLHRRFLRFDPNNALAHYHLGFAYGMVGRTDKEISEYLMAIKLGLHRWDLFLNLGQAYISEQDLAKAAAALEQTGKKANDLKVKQIQGYKAPDDNTKQELAQTYKARINTAAASPSGPQTTLAHQCMP